MNATDSTIPTETPSTQPPPLATETAGGAFAGSPSSVPTDEPQSNHRKIAKLPKPLRDLINSMLDDGAPAREIIARLEASTNPPLPYAITEKNLSDWRRTGYDHYLHHQERRADLQANREGAGGLIDSDDLTTLPEATLQIIANQYYQLFADFSADSLRQKLSEDPLKYTRFLSVFARLVREIVNLRKFREASARARAAIRDLKDPKRKLTESERRALILEVDGLLGLPLGTDFLPPAPGAQPAAESPSSAEPQPSTQPTFSSAL